MPVDAGPRVAKTLWCVSITVLVANLLGLVNLTFMSVWSWTSIIDKTLKCVSRQQEAKFVAWLRRVWKSFSCQGGADNDGEEELPIYDSPV